MATTPTKPRKRTKSVRRKAVGARSKGVARNVRVGRSILTLRRTSRRDSAVQAELEPVIADLRDDLDASLSKTHAAELIGVSVPTLDKWIAGRILPIRKAPSGRPRIPRDTALDLAERIGDLREQGQQRNLITGVVDMLQRQDPTYQREFKELYGPGLAALAEGQLVSAEPPESFGPED